MVECSYFQTRIRNKKNGKIHLKIFPPFIYQAEIYDHDSVFTNKKGIAFENRIKSHVDISNQ